MPPQKRGRSAKTEDREADDEGHAREQDDADMMRDVDSSDDDDDSDSDEDALTFTEGAPGAAADSDDDSDEDMDGGDASTDAAGAKAAGAANGAANGGGLVNVDFVFSDPRESHFHSVKQLLLAYLPSSVPFQVSGLANVIVNQVATGTMVCAEGEEDIYGFITALGLTRYAAEPSVQQVLQYVTKRCPAALAPRLKELLATKSVGLVVNERMINLPYQLVPPLHSALHEDLEWAIANESTPELRRGFEFDYFLILSSCVVERIGAAGGKPGKGKKTKTEYAQTAKFFANFEDEFLEPEAELTFSFETPRGERERADQSTKHSVVMLIERQRHKAALASIAAMINA